MAEFLSDKEIEKLIGTAIINGDKNQIRPNSYILRLGSHGEFLNTNKEFELGSSKKGIIVSPGHAVALTAFEIIDFRRETVSKIFPEIDLYGMISPTTDLSREGIVAPSTHVDSGYYGTLNWTINNTSSEERKFLFKEKLFRLIVIKLNKDERPDKLYDGDYQGELGYVRSKRQGAPVGMKDTEWEDSKIKGGPEEVLDSLIKSGYPWHVLGQKLKEIDFQFKHVSEEYSHIYDTLENMENKINSIDTKYSNFSADLNSVVKNAIVNESTYLQNRWLIGAGSMIGILFGFVLTILTNDKASKFISTNGSWIGLLLVITGMVCIYFISRHKTRTA